MHIDGINNTLITYNTLVQHVHFIHFPSTYTSAAHSVSLPDIPSSSTPSLLQTFSPLLSYTHTQAILLQKLYLSNFSDFRHHPLVRYSLVSYLSFCARGTSFDWLIFVPSVFLTTSFHTQGHLTVPRSIHVLLVRPSPHHPITLSFFFITVLGPYHSQFPVIKHLPEFIPVPLCTDIRHIFQLPFCKEKKKISTNLIKGQEEMSIYCVHLLLPH